MKATGNQAAVRLIESNRYVRTTRRHELSFRTHRPSGPRSGRYLPSSHHLTKTRSPSARKVWRHIRMLPFPSSSLSRQTHSIYHCWEFSAWIFVNYCQFFMKRYAQLLCDGIVLFCKFGGEQTARRKRKREHVGKEVCRTDRYTSS